MGLVTPRLTSGVKNQTQDININFAVFISYVSLVSGTHLLFETPLPCIFKDVWFKGMEGM